MALSTLTVWEIRTGGATTNGGGFTSGGTDYSQQDAAQLSLTDLAAVTAGVVLTSATGGFTAAMVGNIIQITAGTNFTVGFYEIVGHTDTNTVDLDRDPTNGSNASAGTGAVGGALTIGADAQWEAIAAGADIVYIGPGTHTPTGAIDVEADGTFGAPIRVIGYNASRGDTPTGGSEPLIAAAANAFNFDNYWRFENIRVTSTNATGFQGDVGCVWMNCTCDNTSGVAGRAGIASRFGHTSVSNCGASSTNGLAFRSGGQSRFHACYAHDSVEGFLMPAFADDHTFEQCISDTCATGFDASGGSINNVEILGCTIYNSTTGITLAAAEFVILNCALDTYTTGIAASAASASNLVAYCNFVGGGTDVTNVTKGPGCTTNASGFTNAAGGDFSLTGGSALRGAGQGVDKGVGATGSTVDQGAWQAGAGAGGAAGLVLPGAGVQPHG